MIDASANRTLIPAIDEIEDQRRMHRNGRVQRRREPAGAKAYAGDRSRSPGFTRGMERHPAPIACDHVAGFRREPGHLHLHPFQRGVHAANGSSGSGFFREHIPGLEGLPQLKFDSLRRDRADLRKAKLEVRSKPLLLEVVARPAQLAEHIEKVAPDKMRQHKTVMQRRAPTDQAAFERPFPKHADQSANQQHLQQAPF